MTHFASKRFWQCRDALPEKFRRLADRPFKLLEQEPHHHSLHFKKVGRYWSVRVDENYRALGVGAEMGLSGSGSDRIPNMKSLSDHSSLVRPALCSAKASSASLSSFPALAPASICSSHLSESKVSNYARKRASSSRASSETAFSSSSTLISSV
jgi:hypothetical protein